MPSTTYNCPNCKNENKLILLGNNYGNFEQKCKKCSSKIEVEIDKNQNVSKVRFKGNTTTQFEEKGTVPKDYAKMSGDEPILQKKEVKNKREKMVSVVTFLILSASFMGFITAGGLYYSPDEFPDYDEIKIQLIIKNQTSSIDNAEIYVNGILKEQKYLGNGSYEIFLKPGRHDFRVVTTNHATANMEVYIPPQDNNLSLVDYDKGLQGVNLFVFNLEEGNGEKQLDSNTYNLMITWCPGLMLIFSLIGTWGAWTTYTLQSYKNAQIGAFFSIIAMGFFIIGPILGCIALFLLPRIKKFFNRSF
tara:strand:+ start:3447 stop:4358 length:912 start_codon:yes stop_codon:yes gene_type:complete